MHIVFESLLIGNQYEAQAPPPFVSAVLWAALEPALVAPPVAAFARIPLREFAEPDPIDIHAGIVWLHRHLPTHRVLVACKEGKGRSVSLVIAYLCCIREMPYEDAVRFMKRCHPGSTPLPHLRSCIDAVKQMRHDAYALPARS